MNHNLHSAYLSLVDPNFAEAYALADRTIIDGFPILLLANRYRAGRGEAALPADYRCGSNDWIAHFGALPDGHRVALLGASPSSNAAAVDELAARFSHLTFRGWDGFAGVADLEAADFLALREFGPDLVLVGLGMPKQEAFIVRNWDRLPQALYATVGGAIDQISGEQKWRHVGWANSGPSGCGGWFRTPGGCRIGTSWSRFCCFARHSEDEADPRA
ncbi:hypothetical protein GS444_17555 [Rhodococcus hoagii]|nr:hypothetical protein [Prescottella equi]